MMALSCPLFGQSPASAPGAYRSWHQHLQAASLNDYCPKELIYGAIT